MIKCALLGFTGAGKTTTLLSLTETFTSKNEYNIAKVFLPEKRLIALADAADSKKVIPIQIDLIDMPNFNLSDSLFIKNLLEADFIIHIIRAFDNDDPCNNCNMLEEELILKDLDTLQNLKKNLKKSNNFVTDAIEHLSELKLLNTYKNHKELAQYNLITNKPILRLYNVKSDSLHTAKYCDGVVYSASLEQDIFLSSTNDKILLCVEHGIDEPILYSVLYAAYQSTGNIMYFTVGPQEAKAWQIPYDCTARIAARKIHTSLAQKFVAVEVAQWEDFIQFGSWEKCKKIIHKNPEYIIQDGEVCLFRSTK